MALVVSIRVGDVIQIGEEVLLKIEKDPTCSKTRLVIECPRRVPITRHGKLTHEEFNKLNQSLLAHKTKE